MDISKLFANIILNGKTPYYLQISSLIRDKIIDGTLPEGERLPAERELAAILKVSRTTAINAYRNLEEKGYVEIRKGSGTYVCSRNNQPGGSCRDIPWPQLLKPDIQPSMASMMMELMVSSLPGEMISLDAGMPDPSFYPTEVFRKLYDECANELDQREYGYIPIQGYEPLRTTISGLLSEKGIDCPYEQIMTISGSQQGIYLSSRVLVEPGDYVVIQAPAYVGAIQVFQSMGARLLSLPEGDRLPLDILEDYLTRYRPKLFYCVPTFQNPCGAVMSVNDRKALIGLASRYRLVILEDDPYSSFYYNELPPPSLKALDTYGGVIYLSTFSKNIMPGLRLGYLAAHPSFINRVVMEKQYIDLHSNNSAQWLVNTFIRKGYFAGHLEKTRAAYKSRRDTIVEALNSTLRGRLSFNKPEGGFYLWCRSEDIPAKRLLQEALKEGVSFIPGEAFYTVPSSGTEMRLCFSRHGEKVLVEGAARLERAYGNIRGRCSIASGKEMLPII
ncbi:MAG TPA: PLP-dependent aminotransferase family protein [Negativicutes bacterium]|nr:PLP-dependent aminotransferase family protein [Negativicutes bacterium]